MKSVYGAFESVGGEGCADVKDISLNYGSRRLTDLSSYSTLRRMDADVDGFDEDQESEDMVTSADTSLVALCLQLGRGSRDDTGTSETWF